MPIYEFVCRDCNKDFEKLTPASERDRTPCPTCGSQKTARKISLTAPAQVKAGGKGFSAGEGCGMPNCCGGACGLPD
jgi:putative FmdB family regulatory protein